MNLPNGSPSALPNMQTGVRLLPTLLTLSSWAGGTAVVVLSATVIISAYRHRRKIAPWVSRPRNLLRLAGGVLAAAVWIWFLTDTISRAPAPALTLQRQWPFGVGAFTVLSTVVVVYLVLSVSRERPIACFPDSKRALLAFVGDETAGIAAIDPPPRGGQSQSKRNGRV